MLAYPEGDQENRREGCTVRGAFFLTWSGCLIPDQCSIGKIRFDVNRCIHRHFDKR